MNISTLLGIFQRADSQFAGDHAYHARIRTGTGETWLGAVVECDPTTGAVELVTLGEPGESVTIAAESIESVKIESLP